MFKMVRDPEKVDDKYKDIKHQFTSIQEENKTALNNRDENETVITSNAIMNNFKQKIAKQV